MKSDLYQPRTYRNWVESKDLIVFNVVERETDLFIRATANLERKARRLVLKCRSQIEKYAEKHPAFLSSLEPIPVMADAPRIVQEMARASASAGVGPMAAVAGAIAEYVGRRLIPFSAEIIVENGGDIFLKTVRKRVIGIFAGSSPLTGKIGLEIAPQQAGLGICTSSGTVGHSLSFGRADAAIALAASAALADAAATAIGNMVKQPQDIKKALDFARSIEGLKGAVVIIGDDIGAWGEVTLCPTSV